MEQLEKEVHDLRRMYDKILQVKCNPCSLHMQRQESAKRGECKDRRVQRVGILNLARGVKRCATPELCHRCHRVLCHVDSCQGGFMASMLTCTLSFAPVPAGQEDQCAEAPELARQPPGTEQDSWAVSGWYSCRSRRQVPCLRALSKFHCRCPGTQAVRKQVRVMLPLPLILSISPLRR